MAPVIVSSKVVRTCSIRKEKKRLLLLGSCCTHFLSHTHTTHDESRSLADMIIRKEEEEEEEVFFEAEKTRITCSHACISFSPSSSFARPPETCV